MIASRSASESRREKTSTSPISPKYMRFPSLNTCGAPLRRRPPTQTRLIWQLYAMPPVACMMLPVTHWVASGIHRAVEAFWRSASRQEYVR